MLAPGGLVRELARGLVAERGQPRAVQVGAVGRHGRRRALVVEAAGTGLDLEGLRASAKVFAKDEAGVADHMKFIADEADRLGVNLMTATKEFTKFAISTKNKVGQDSARQIFSGVSEYASVLQADQQQFERAFRSINQMLSKGNLMAEEVNFSLLT